MEREENAKERAKRVCREHFLVENTVFEGCDCQLIFVTVVVHDNGGSEFGNSGIHYVLQCRFLPIQSKSMGPPVFSSSKEVWVPSAGATRLGATGRAWWRGQGRILKSILGFNCRNEDQACQQFQYKDHFLSEAFRPGKESARCERSAWSLFSKENCYP